ncbi:MAG TPA: fluoride efflux transporter CrcB [Gillisia sp.]|nr:fluoride efflux transporter CrcB [Gillisia sp.]
MKAILLVFVGGGLGSALRFLVYRGMLMLNLASVYGTFTVNIIGSLLLGFLMGYFLKEGHVLNNVHLFVATGFCGGFTTFSTFAFENQAFLRSGDYTQFLIYAFGSLFIGILAIITGVFLAKFI